MRIELKKRLPLPAWKVLLLPLLALVLSFALSSVFIVIAKANVWEAWKYIVKGGIGSRFAFLETLIKMTPMCLTGLAVTVAFRAKFWNIGAEGQLYAGAMAAALFGILPLGLPAFLHILIIMLVGFIAGGLWAILPAYLKVKYKVDDIVTTLMLNYIIIYIMKAILDTVWRDKISGWAHSPTILDTARYPILVPRSRFHLGFVIAIACAFLVYGLIKHTGLGYRLRAVGFNPKASEYGGIHVSRTILVVAMISGGLAGLAGIGEVCGMQFYLVEGISPGYGYYGVAIAMLANLQPMGVILSSFFFAVIFTGSQMMSRYTGVPVYLTEMLQGLTLITMMVALLLNRFTIRIRTN